MARFSVNISSLLLGLVFAAGCVPARGWGWSEPAEQSQAASARAPLIVVLPVRAGSRLPVSGAEAICHLTGEHFEPGPVTDSDVREVSAELSSALAEHGLRLVPRPLVESWLTGADRVRLYNYEKALGVEAARATRADLALMGVLIRYRERSGTWWASGSPASVAFTLVLVEAKSGKVLWSYRYDKVQVPLWRSSEVASGAGEFRSQESLPPSAELYPASWWDSLRWFSRRELLRKGMSAAVRSLSRELMSVERQEAQTIQASTWRRACGPASWGGPQPGAFSCRQD